MQVNVCLVEACSLNWAWFRKERPDTPFLLSANLIFGTLGLLAKRLDKIDGIWSSPGYACVHCSRKDSIKPKEYVATLDMPGVSCHLRIFNKTLVVKLDVANVFLPSRIFKAAKHMYSDSSKYGSARWQVIEKNAAVRGWFNHTSTVLLTSWNVLTKKHSSYNPLSERGLRSLFRIQGVLAFSELHQIMRSPTTWTVPTNQHIVRACIHFVRCRFILDAST